jgi:predicted RNA binding protein YcfA (HicA-like mRNA interferase family)
MRSAKAADFQRLASRLGFSKTRTTGSHERGQHPDGEIGPPVHFKIIRQLDVTNEEFERLR